MEAARQKLEAQLRAELDTLVNRHARINAHRTNADREVPADWDERAQLFENDEVLDALDGRTRARIIQIRLTLDRLEDRDWGQCERCGEAINPSRLAVVPTTPHCLSCAEELAG